MEMLPKALYLMYSYFFAWCRENGLDLPIEILPPDVFSAFFGP